MQLALTTFLRPFSDSLSFSWNESSCMWRKARIPSKFISFFFHVNNYHNRRKTGQVFVLSSYWTTSNRLLKGRAFLVVEIVERNFFIKWIYWYLTIIFYPKGIFFFNFCKFVINIHMWKYLKITIWLWLHQKHTLLIIKYIASVKNNFMPSNFLIKT